MIGGSAITVHTGHRLSGDADLVLRNLARDWQQVRSGLEELQDWITEYPKIPTNLMGRYRDGRVSVRKLNRLRDIEIAEISYKNRTLRVAATDELVRMKASPCSTAALPATTSTSRPSTRDYARPAPPPPTPSPSSTSTTRNTSLPAPPHANSSPHCPTPDHSNRTRRKRSTS